MSATKLELIRRENLLKDAKKDVGKTKTVAFTFTQMIDGALCILDVPSLVTRVVGEQRTGNQVVQV